MMQSPSLATPAGSQTKNSPGKSHLIQRNLQRADLACDDLHSQPAQALVRHCPKCGSVRVHRSRRRGMLDASLNAMGADILRCHDCRARQAWFGVTPLRLRGTQGDGPALTGVVLFATGSVVCVLLIWWMISRYTDLSG